MAEYHESPNSINPADSGASEIHQFLLQKLITQGGDIIGLHGTSAAITQRIETEGFRNYRCIEGGYGVWFADDSVPGLAVIPGIRKALENGDSRYAIITAQLNEPQPDVNGRKQWLAHASSTKILNIAYFDLQQ